MLSVSTFILLLTVARFKEIARFGALVGDIKSTLLFTVYQFPTILPIAIAISALISSVMFSQKMSQTHELTAFRASGLSIQKILLPLFISSLFLMLLNFIIYSEVAPFCKSESKNLLYAKSSDNPLYLLQRQDLVRLNRSHVQCDAKSDHFIKNFIYVNLNPGSSRLSLFSVENLQFKKNELIGKNVSFISHTKDHLIIETQKRLQTNASFFSSAMKKKSPKLKASSMNFKSLLYKSKENQKLSKDAYAEILKRISLSLAVFSFTVLGSCYAVEFGRITSKKNLISIIILALFVLITMLSIKSVKHSKFFSVCYMLLPHLLIWIVSIRKIAKVQKGLT